jgi:predicted nucleic acid-binding protein
MSARYFLDTNVLAYTFDNREPRKAQVADRLVAEGIQQRTGIISYQVMQEFLNVALKRFNPPLASNDAQQYLSSVLRRLLAVQSSVALCSEALQIRDRYQLSWYDCLIVAAALEARCEILYTEDLQHGQRFGGLLVVNPFL